jgi:hypothetical protein
MARIGEVGCAEGSQAQARMALAARNDSPVSLGRWNAEAGAPAER